LRAGCHRLCACATRPDTFSCTTNATNHYKFKWDNVPHWLTSHHGTTIVL
jgi:hypothetical protein